MRCVKSPLAAALMTLTALSLNACASGPTRPSVTLKGQRFTVEIAADEASRERGLMFREHLDADHGMLFVFEDSEVRTFWMKNTKIPLDILYFDDRRHLVSMQQRVPPCTIDPCPVYASTGPAHYVLELNAGEADKLGLTPGDTMTIEH